MSLDLTSRVRKEKLACFSPVERDKVRGLLIDDDAADAANIRQLAAKSKQLDFRPKVCFTIDDARRILSEQTFDVVYIDYWLGWETSVAFISEFTKRHHAPCVMLTGLDEPDTRRVAFRAGVNAFLAKDEISTQAIEGVTLAVMTQRANR